ncbi:MAG: phosphatidylglycerophosphatase A [Puniceicoccaceae bacterium]|nr:phosphatidylglycerophosphatase A [Puniceicoccaceae bacterium]
MPIIMQIKFRFLWARFIPRSIVINLATLGGMGNHTSMPGTLGSVFGFILYALCFHYLNPFFYGVFLIALAYLAAGICDAAEYHLMEKDPSAIILDECVAVPFVFFGLNAYNPLVLQLSSWPIYIGGFLLFRFFDILKPFGIARLEKIRGGLGCVADDLISALISCLILHITIVTQVSPS